MRYTDPTGHKAVCGEYGEECSDEELHAITGGGNGGGGGSNDDDEDNRPQLSPNLPPTGTGICGSGYYSPHCPGWHFYTTTNLVCPAYLHCTEEEMKYWFLRFVFPGQDPSEPVVNGNSYSVSFCINDRCLPMGPYGAIRVDLVDDFTAVNTTLSTHILYDGQVVRHLHQDEGGAWYVSSYGYGNNTTTTGTIYTTQGPQNVEISTASANQLFGPFIFNNGDYQMLQTILLNH